MKLIYTVIKIIILLLFLLLFLLLAVINTDAVTFSYLPGQKFDLPLIVVLFGAFVVGIVFGMFALFGRLLSLRGENGRLRAEVKKNARLTGKELTAPPAQNAPESAKQP
ncbi:LapA family protein [Neisseria meningitidis]|uniref:LapA family protein n=1 Tax=Neisseria meningitidis TaxID=487 RepID=UPI000E572727|nr:lipopolysaccharide assembly protein LapA domain-containing protein [Neisseria meningitidis]MCL6013135.1 lipopolysaccharide assembly protein LapA domain-containing protein [Neisseria meningitidis]MCL6126088.1 lipopolysaccharide assembly protein LapA domain-containing protein [Neisseria meningitidis]